MKSTRFHRPTRLPYAAQVRVLAQWPPSPEMAQDTCWPSPSTERTPHGYARVRLGGRWVPAHRLAWTAARNLPIDFLPPPRVRQVDHVARLGCNSRDCFSPFHLELVTPDENNRRSDSASVRNAAKTHCPAGHELTDDNLIPYRLARGKRDCLTCHRERQREYNRRRRAALKSGAITIKPCH